MFAHMSYDDENLHLVFKYNEEYEDDLEIHKSTTIQSLYTHRPAALPPPEDESEEKEVGEDDEAEGKESEQAEGDVP